MKNAKEVMAIADETVVRSEENQKLKNSKIAKGKLVYWLLGILFSLLPLFASPFSGFIKNGDFSEMFYKLFCDASILFVGISFTITSLNDFVAECAKKDEYGWIGLNLFLLFLGAIIYTTLVLEEDKDINIVFNINVFYFVTMFLLSASKYINEVRGIRNGNT